MRKISILATILITSFVMTLAGLVAGPIATASETETVRVSATFPLGTSVLTDAQKLAIKRAFTTAGTDATFLVTGVAGKLPGVSDSAVRILAKKRSQALKSYLLKLGVSKASVTTKVKITRLGLVPKTKIVGSVAVPAIDTTPITTTPITTTPTATPNTPITTSGAPTNPVGTIANGQSIVSWTAPASNGGATITGYTVTSSPGSFTCTDASTSCTVTGLTNGTAYTFTVTATNSAGTGSASNASSSVTPITTAGAPTSVTATAGDTQGVVSWTAPASNGGAAIISYTVASTPGGFLCSHASTSCTVAGLTNGTSYTFTVTATNSAGTGSASTSSSAITPAALVLTCATGGTCVVGNTGPGGGLIYYVDSSAGGFACGPTLVAICHYLEVAPSGWNIGPDPKIKWTNSAQGSNDIGDIVNDVAVNATTSSANSSSGIGLGYKNSEAIRTQNATAYNASTNHYAAGAARAYAGNSKSDWYLPATAELNLLCQWARGVSPSVTTKCAIGTINSDTYGASSAGFEENYYWSSSEFNAANSWLQTFASGDQYEGDKYDAVSTVYALNVRPVRAF